MKTVLKFLTLGLVLTAFGALSTFAQATADECAAIYEKFKAERVGPDIPKYQAAIVTGKDWLNKCKDLKEQEEVRAYIERQIPNIEKKIVAEQEAITIAAFDAAVKAKDTDKSFSLGKQIIAKNPDFLDVMLVLASMGFDKSFANPPVETYNADAINMANMFIQKAGEGKTSENWGAYAYVYKTTACPDGKTNATGWMNYTIGFLTSKKSPKDGVPYLYKATQVGCETKDKISNVYRLIGSWYIDEFKRLETEKNTVYAKLQKLELDVKAATPETKADLEKQFTDTEKQYNDILALQKGYMERVADAYFRAYKISQSEKIVTTEYKNALLSRAKEFYGFRFGKDNTGFDSWSAGVNAKPFPDPTSAVTPVVEAPSTATTTPGTGNR